MQISDLKTFSLPNKTTASAVIQANSFSIIQKNFRDLTEVERVKLKSLTAKNGTFGFSLRKFLRPDDQNNQVLICHCFNTDKFIAWGMYYPENKATGAQGFDIYKLDGVNWGVFVAAEYRRQGIGSALTYQAVKNFGSLAVYHSDQINRNFFSKQKNIFEERFEIR